MHPITTYFETKYVVHYKKEVDNILLLKTPNQYISDNE